MLWKIKVKVREAIEYGVQMRLKINLDMMKYTLENDFEKIIDAKATKYDGLGDIK